MQQRQLRLGDILDDYCPRERRLTNHVVVAMIGSDVKQTRCTTCDSDHEYKHAKIPRPRKKGDEPAALYAQVLDGKPKRVVNEPSKEVDAPAVEMDAEVPPEGAPITEDPTESVAAALDSTDTAGAEDSTAPDDDEREDVGEEGPVHRPLIRATLPRHEGQVSPGRPAPDFTIRQPTGGRPPNRFRGRHQQGGQQPFQGNRSGGPMNSGGRGGSQQRQQGGRPPHGSVNARPSRRHDSGHKRSK